MSCFITPEPGIYDSVLGFSSVREALWMLLSVCLCESLYGGDLRGVSFQLEVKGEISC